MAIKRFLIVTHFFFLTLSECFAFSFRLITHAYPGLQITTPLCMKHFSASNFNCGRLILKDLDAHMASVNFIGTQGPTWAK